MLRREFRAFIWWNSSVAKGKWPIIWCNNTPVCLRVGTLAYDTASEAVAQMGLRVRIPPKALDFLG